MSPATISSVPATKETNIELGRPSEGAPGTGPAPVSRLSGLRLARQHPPDKASVAKLRLAKARERGKQALALGLSVVDAGQEGLGDLVQRLGAEATGDEIPERLVCVALSGGDEELKTHAQFAQRRDERRQKEGLELGRNQQEDAVRQRDRSALREDVDLPGSVVRAEQSFAKTELQRQVHGPGLSGRQEGVGAAFDNEPALFALDDVGEDPAAPAIRRLVDRAHDGDAPGRRLAFPRTTPCSAR